MTSKFRVLPDFIIIGAQRCGTTSLFDYLIKHPNIRPCYQKEVHFFDRNFYRGLNWYRSFFPVKQSKLFVKKNETQKYISGEATPYYFFHPLAPERVAKTLANVKLIMLLRNPVDRAYSHYWHSVNNNLEKTSFQDAIKSEPERLEKEMDNFNKYPGYRGFKYQNYSYLARGIYVTQLNRWHQFFPKEQILVLQSEVFFSEPGKILNRIFQFLDLSDFNNTIIQHQAGNYPKMDSAIRAKLIEYYRPYNRKLYDLLGNAFPWNQ